MPGLKQAWPIVAACWSPATPRIGIAAPRIAFSVDAEIVGAVLDLGQQRRRDVEDVQQLRVPRVLRDVVDQRARGVGGVGGVHLAAGQPPDRGSVSIVPASSSPLLGPLPRAFHVVEQPGDLGAGEIGIEQQAGLARERLSRARPCCSVAQSGAVRRSCQTMALWIGFAGRLVPDHHRLALVGDADAGDVGRLDLGLCAAPSCRPPTTLCQISSGSCSTQPDAG